jgi:sulfide:quinone oxidoreductase
MSVPTHKGAEDGMVKIVQLEPGIAVAPQLAEADFADIAARGFRAVVNSRPDGEAASQLPNARAEAVARRHGLAFRHHPVRNVNVTDNDIVDGFARLMDELPGPILFYCGTGTRCIVQWTQAAAPRLGIDGALARARAAGYDLDFLRETLAEREDWRAAPAASLLPALQTHTR